VNKSRRRYAGYIVHVGIVLVYIHFAGRAWTTDIETSIAKGDSLQIDEAYTVRYLDSRVESDPEKRIIITELEVIERGKVVGTIMPSKFIYKSMGGTMSTEVARHITLRDDLYATLANVDPQTELATFQFHVNPFALIMLLGALISLFPDVQDPEITVWTYMRSATGFATTAMFCAMLVFWPRVTTGPPPSKSASTAPAAVEPALDPGRPAALPPVEATPTPALP
jgi:cytochrome c-type biogenesis protein CcmF